MFDENSRPPEEISFGNFNNSMNMIFGLVNHDSDWDVLNNPYIEYKAH